MWMVGTSLVLLLIAILFLRNQIRPIQRSPMPRRASARAAMSHFRPRGAREVRRRGARLHRNARRIERRSSSARPC
jgi:two-component system osmolarity sensor histidine kinase EnvZ